MDINSFPSDNELQGMNPAGFCIKDTDFRECDQKDLQRLFACLCKLYGMPERLGYEFINPNHYVILKSWLAYFSARDIDVIFVFGTVHIPIFTLDGKAVSAFEVRVYPQDSKRLTDMQKEAIPVVLCEMTDFAYEGYTPYGQERPFLQSLDNLTIDNFNYFFKVPVLKVKL